MKKIIDTIFKCIENSKAYDEHKNKKVLNYLKKINNNKIKKGKISLENSNVIVEKNIEDEFALYVSYKNTNDEKTIPIKVIVKSEYFEVHDNRNDDIFDCTIKLLVPNCVEELLVQSKTGNIEMNRQNVEKVALNSETGNIILNESELRYGYIRVMTGNVLARNIRCFDVNILSDNGNVILDKCNLNKTNIKNLNGNIVLKKCKTKIDARYIRANSENGCVQLDVKEITNLHVKNENEYIDLYSENGNIKIELFGDER